VLNIIGSGRFPGKAVVFPPTTDCRRGCELNNGYCPRRNAALVFGVMLQIQWRQCKSAIE
jgi:hypothetical protein